MLRPMIAFTFLMSNSLPGLAMPASPNEIINGVLNNKEFKNLILEMDSNSHKLTIEVLAGEERFRGKAKCQEMSRSGSVARIKYANSNEESKSFLFATPSRGYQISLCDNGG